MTLTKEETKSGRIRILADGGFVCSVTKEMWLSLGYFDSEEISEEELEKLKKNVEYRYAYMGAVRILTLRENSEKELRTKLLKKFSPDAVEYAVKKSEELGFTDDRKFAEDYSEELYERKRYGKARIRSELIKKGIDTSIIEEVLSSLPDSDENIMELLRKKADGADIENPKEKRKIFSFLSRYGYSYSEINDAFNLCLEEQK